MKEPRSRLHKVNTDIIIYQKIDEKYGNKLIVSPSETDRFITQFKEENIPYEIVASNFEYKINNNEIVLVDIINIGDYYCEKLESKILSASDRSNINEQDTDPNFSSPT